MGINYLIFLSTSLLLVPLVYASSSLPDACAAIRDPKFDTGDCQQKNGKQTCCWYEKYYPGQFGRGDKYCQTCSYYHDANGQAYEKCTDPKKQAIQGQLGSDLLQNGENLKLKSNSNETKNSNPDTSLNSSLLQKGGDLQLRPKDNTTRQNNT